MNKLFLKRINKPNADSYKLEKKYWFSLEYLHSWGHDFFIITRSRNFEKLKIIILLNYKLSSITHFLA